MPELSARVRLSRAKGFRLQDHAPGAVVVARPTRFGNPFLVADAIEDDPDLDILGAHERCTRLYDLWLEGDLELTDPSRVEQRAWILEQLPALAGHPLACWCPLPASGQPDWCHAAVLLKRAALAVAVEPWSDHLETPPLDKRHGFTRTVVPGEKWSGAL